MAGLRAFTYDLPCTSRGQFYFPTGVRQALFILIAFEDEYYGLGEYAPHKGIHQHNITSVLAGIKSLWQKRAKDILSLPLDLDVFEYVHLFESFSEPFDYLLSMAHFHRILKTKKIIENASIKLPALIEPNTIEQAMINANNYMEQGFSCFKVKVGDFSVEEEIKKIKMLVAVKRSDITIRLDANKKFCLDEAVALVRGLKNIRIEYFEEPLSNPHDMKRLYEATGVNIAVDESFSAPFDMNYLINLGAQFLIIKPSRFKSVYHALYYAKEAVQNGIKPIFSHCFESEFSAAIFAHLIHYLGLYEDHHGIFADGFFKHKSLKSIRGQLSLESCNKLLHSI